jgi:hypothetical protein
VLSEKQLGAARKPYGELPLIVLGRSISPYAEPGKSPGALNQAVEEANRTTLDEIAKLSSRGSLRVVPNAGHLIEADQPQAVVDAVLELLPKSTAAAR